MIELLLVMAIIAILAAVGLPPLSQAKGRARRISCICNLKGVGLGFRMWSRDHGDRFPMAVSITTNGTMEFNETGQVFRHFQVLSNELHTPKVLLCPSDAGRTRATDWTKLSNKNLSYFVGLDADEANPQTILSGDRNVTGGIPTNGNIMLFTTNRQAGWSKELHQHHGNLGLGDGSAQQVTEDGLRRQMQSATNEVIWLAIP